jgi:hypothetical protein
MRVGVLDLLYDRLPDRGFDIYGYYFRKQYMGIMPQTVAVWCGRAGHDVHYRTYWGQADPLDLLPDDLDVLFVSAYTHSSALAYAIAAVFKSRRTLTVVGGPHARAFPTDCSRFFDIVVQNCDRALVEDILRRRFDPPAIVSSAKPLAEFPSVEERMPYIRTSAFYRDRSGASSTVPMLSSVGCPYSCGFCVDWNTNYVTLPADQLQADLEFLSSRHPTLLMAFHDPNFGVRFDATMDVLCRIPVGRRNRYMMESSLSILKSGRLARLADTNCIYIAPGVESWVEYSGKAGTGARTGRDKLERVIAHFRELSEHVRGIQANFMFGGDSDQGDEPVALTKEFIERAPEVWPTINIPTPYGGTPLYDQMRRDGRILEATPLTFYYNPNLAITLKHYDPRFFYDKMIELTSAAASASMLMRRLRARTRPMIAFVDAMRSLGARFDLGALRRIRARLDSDAQFLAYHQGRSGALPAIYGRSFEQRLGRYATLVPPAARRPTLDPPAAAVAPRLRAM